MRRTSFASMNCSVARTLEVVGEWWTMLIVREAFFGVRRFDSMQQRLGIARNVLATRLQSLVDHGILERRRYQERPERFEYRLTEKGLDLYPVLVAMMRWGDRWTVGEDGPPVTLLHQPCGNETTPMTTCSACGEALLARDMRARTRAAAGPSAPGA
ncbi:MAG: helix-turn-helix transcriptional regulator [Thermoflexaceae bacterium]|nr:helix-turn-helix transcriptional regulator [Thermoflexaceae bacterium]